MKFFEFFFPEPVPFLGYIDLVGTFHVGTVVAAGYGKYFGVPLMRTFAEKKEEKGEKITEDEAREQIMNAMKVLLYRDCKTINRVSLFVFLQNFVAELLNYLFYLFLVEIKSSKLQL